MVRDDDSSQDAFLRTMRPVAGLDSMHDVTLSDTAGSGEDGDDGEDDDDSEPDFDAEATDDGEGLTRLGNYLLLTKLGEGGMGVVHAAYDPQLDRKVAIKLLRGDGEAQARRRLQREAQAQARLSHPNVVQIYEIGEVDQRLFIVMEFVAGRTLKRWLERERGRGAILEVFCAAGRGLAAAHEQGLVHRDFKPDNVLVADDGRVLVMDFGLARAERGRVDELTDDDADADRRQLVEPSGLTATGILMGTPAYMAPEQFEGRGIDARTDQFSFCVALWEALHEQRPFIGATFGELSRAVCSGRVTTPEGGAVPGWLREVVARGLAVDPARRWPSMDALLEALRRDPTHRRRVTIGAGGLLAATAAALLGLRVADQHARDQRVRACEQQGQAIRDDWNPDVAAAIGRSFAATEIGFAGAAWEHTRVQLDAYVDAWAEARTAACLDGEAGETGEAGGGDPQRAQDIAACLDERRAAVVGLLAAWTTLDEAAVMRATQAAVMLPPVSTCTTELWLAQRIRPPQAEREEIAALHGRLEQATAQAFVGRYRDSLVEVEAVRERAQALGYRPLEAQAGRAVAMRDIELGDYDAAAVAGEQAYLAAVGGGDEREALLAASMLASIEGDRRGNPQRGRYWADLAQMYVERLALTGSIYEANVLANRSGVELREGDYEAALVSNRRALALYEQLLGAEHLQTATALNSLGAVQRLRGAPEEALPAFRRALAIRESVLGPEHPDVAMSRHNIGVVLWDQGRYDEALVSHRRALAIREASLGPEHPAVAMSLNAIGAVLGSEGHYRDALAAFTRALAIDELRLGPEHPDLAGSLTNVGSIQRSLGEHEAALASHQRALAIWQAALGEAHPYVAMALNNIGVAQLELGRNDEALASHRQALAIRETALGPDHRDVAQSLTNIAVILGRSGQERQALGPLRRALAIREAALGPDHPSVAESRANLGSILLSLGEHEEAQSQLEQALALHQGLQQPPEDQAEVRFDLAQVLWARGHHEQARAQALAAQDDLAKAEHAERIAPADIEAWLAAHP